MHNACCKHHEVDHSDNTFRKLISLTFDQHQQDDQQVPAGILAFICHELPFPVCGHETPQHIELAASSIIICIAQSAVTWSSAMAHHIILSLRKGDAHPMVS